MTPYLLSSQSVLDIVKHQNLPAELWLKAAADRGVVEDDICISAVVPMTVLNVIDKQYVKARAEKSDALLDLATLRKSAQKFFAALPQDRIISMDDRIAECWGDLLDVELDFTRLDGKPDKVGSSEKVELATAKIGLAGHGFTYIDKWKDYHERVEGLVVECPVEITKGL